MSKEEEYMRLNAELEAKTASLIKEAEDVLQDQEQLLSRPVQLDRNYEADISETLTENTTFTQKESNKQKKSRPLSAKDSKRPTSKTKSARSRPKSAHSGQGRQPSAKEENSVEVMMRRENLLEDRIQLANTISVLEGESEDTLYSSEMTDDVLPEAAEDLSSEAVIRFLKAKLRVMQEELDRISAESISKDEKIASREQKTKELQEEQQRVQKTNQSLQAQSDKYKKLYEETKRTCEGVESQLVSLRKEQDNLQRDQKQAVVAKNAIEVRLNRALEEVEKYKTATQKEKTSFKDASEQEKRRSEQLVAENKRLDKQKSELMTAFKKQMKLIDILKRQKMHIEASRLLSFTEEEFVKALDWGK